MSNDRSRLAAFTLVELLIVMAILAMLVAITIPSFARAYELARSGVCKNTLRQLSALAHTLGSKNTLGVQVGSRPRLPMYNDWDVLVHESNKSQYLRCPSAGEPTFDASATLRNVYIRQDGGGNSVTPGVVVSYLYDILYEDTVNDSQIHYTYQGRSNGGGWGWVQALNEGQPPRENQAFLAITTCAAFVVTFEKSYVEVRPLGHHPNWSSGSSHWVCKGDPEDADTWQGDILVRLTGVGYETVNDPVRISAFHETDYGMNNLVPPHSYRTDQLLFVDYSDAIVRLEGVSIDEPFDDDVANGEVLDRHLGRANLVCIDGRVTGMSKEELRHEYERRSDRRSLWAE